jgi:hypothetical protein
VRNDVVDTQDRTEEQFSIALDSIQGKRRVERVVEAANALLDRYSNETGTTERLRALYELIRRNITERVTVRYGDVVFGPAESSAEPGEPGDAVYRCRIAGPGGQEGGLTAHYREPGPMGLTVAEWRSAMALLAGIGALGAGGRAWPA